MTIARIDTDAGTIVEQRSDISLWDVPEHKRQLWRIVPDKPAHDARVETLIGPKLEADEIIWSIEPRSPADVQAAFAEAIQAHIDGVAASRGYASGFGLAGYISSTIPQWSAEAATFVAWRDSVWMYAHGELAKVQNGQRNQPGIEELISELPEIDWS